MGRAGWFGYDEFGPLRVLLRTVGVIFNVPIQELVALA